MEIDRSANIQGTRLNEGTRNQIQIRLLSGLAVINDLLTEVPVKPTFVPGASELIAAFIGMSLLCCLAFPAVVVLDEVKFAGSSERLWSFVPFGFVIGGYACLIAWSAFSTIHWLKRLIAFVVLLLAGVGLVIFGVKETSPFWDVKQELLMFALVGVMSHLPLLAIKHLCGTQLVRQGATLQSPNMKMILYSLLPFMILGLIASRFRSQFSFNLAVGTIYAGLLCMIIGIPAFFLSRSWHASLRWRLAIGSLVLLCFIPVVFAFTFGQDFVRGELFRFGFWANFVFAVSFLLAVGSGILILIRGRLSFATPARIAGRWVVEPSTKELPVQPTTPRINAIVGFVAVVCAAFMYFITTHDVRMYLASAPEYRLSNSRFEKELQQCFHDFETSLRYREHMINSRKFAANSGKMNRFSVHMEDLNKLMLHVDTIAPRIQTLSGLDELEIEYDYRQTYWPTNLSLNYTRQEVEETLNQALPGKKIVVDWYSGS